MVGRLSPLAVFGFHDAAGRSKPDFPRFRLVLGEKRGVPSSCERGRTDTAVENRTQS